MPSQPLLSLVVPCYNEERNVGALAKSVTETLVKAKIPYQLILVDNGSWDKTQEIIKTLLKKNKSITLVHVVKNQGYGNGILQGMKEAKGDFIGYIDGDGQIPPSVVVTVYEKLSIGLYDMVMGRRILRKESFIRTVASKVYNALFRLFFFVRNYQINSKPKIMKKSMYQQLHLESKDWFLDSEILIKAKRHHFRIGEVPYPDQKREGGRSTVRFKVIFEFLKNMCRYLFLR